MFSAQRISSILLFILFSLMLLAPTLIMGVKIALMLMIIVINLLSQGNNFWRMNLVVYGVISVILLSGVYNISSAVINETMTTSELNKVIPFNLIHPILYLLLIPTIMGEKNINRTCHYFVIIYFLLIFRDMINVMAVINGITPPLVFGEGELYVVTDNSIGFNSGSHYSIMYLMPIFFTLGFVGELKKKIFVIGFLLTIIQVALSSSVALIVIFVLCMIIPFITNKILPKTYRTFRFKHVGMLLIPIFIFFTYNFFSSDYSDAAIDNFTSHFDSDTDLRFEQRQVLINAWKQSPFLGHGYGASFVTSARGRESGFESMYHATLATTGLVGLLIILTYYYLIIANTYRLIKKTSSPYFLALLLCFISAIICSSTNPALGTFDGLFPIYTCLACCAAKSGKTICLTETCSLN